MTCKACDEAQDNGTGVYPYRIGNKRFGWAAIMIVACREHAALAIGRLNDYNRTHDENTDDPLTREYIRLLDKDEIKE